jgi:hypothetical protein
MPRTLLLLLFAVLALLLQGRAVFAGPPEGVSGAMTLDEVAEGLRRYRKETDPEKRIRWLEKLAPTRDPRVGVALGETFGQEPEAVWYCATQLVIRYYFTEPVANPEFDPGPKTDRWWKQNEADLRRRARELPQ